MVKSSKKQKKLNVTFRENDYEENLYNYALEQGKIEVGGMSGYIKRLIEKDMKEKGSE